MHAPVKTILVCLFVTCPSLALHIRQYDRIVAWSDDSASALISVDRSGPEGGGSIGFRLISPKRNIDTEFILSSNFSPGNGSSPQTIPAASCKSSVKALSKLLTKCAFKGIKVNPGSCQHDRAATLLISEECNRHLYDRSRCVRLDSGRATIGEIKIVSTGDTIQIDDGQSSALFIKRYHWGHQTLTAYLSPNRKTVLLIGDFSNETRLLCVFAHLGKWESFQGKRR
jgi:hypothetical protein